MDYKVGQIFYLVGTETTKVIPFRIVEEVTRTTLEGIEKCYIAELPDNNKTTIDVTKLRGKIFEDVDSLRTFMTENAKSAIESMIENAMKLSSVTYDQKVIVHEEVKANENVKESSVQLEANDDIVKVDIGNGVMANMKIDNLKKVAQV